MKFIFVTKPSIDSSELLALDEHYARQAGHWPARVCSLFERFTLANAPAASGATAERRPSSLYEDCRNRWGQSRLNQRPYRVAQF
jgi:hypothetical protein